MFRVLLESAAVRTPRPTRWSMASTMIHAAVVTTAVALTMRADVAPAEPPAGPLNPVFLPVPPTPAPDTRRSDGRSGTTTTPLPAVVIALPAVPTIDASIPFGQGTPPLGDIFARQPGILPPSPASDVPGGGVHAAGSVDRRVVASPRNPAPEYPSILRTAGLEGAVLITFVVDTTGRVEEESLRVMEATHPQFAEAVRRWLPRTRYTPAEIHGVRVRQLVQQRVDFTLGTAR